VGANRIRELEIQLEIEKMKNEWKRKLAENSIFIILIIMMGIASVFCSIYQTGFITIK
jgi:hypothetical protein